MIDLYQLAVSNDTLRSSIRVCALYGLLPLVQSFFHLKSSIAHFSLLIAHWACHGLPHILLSSTSGLRPLASNSHLSFFFLPADIHPRTVSRLKSFAATLYTGDSAALSPTSNLRPLASVSRLTFSTAHCTLAFTPPKTKPPQHLLGRLCCFLNGGFIPSPVQEAVRVHAPLLLLPLSD
jgi:hypothetical protein